MTEQKKRFFVIGGIILVAVLSRLMPHPYNFTPIAAIALFGGAYFLDKRWAYAVPILAMLFSDIVLHGLFLAGVREFPGFYPDMILVYAAFAVVVGMGTSLGKRINPFTVVGGSLAASLLFFLITNFGSWITLPIYSKDLAGLAHCYAAGIPFLKWTMLGDLVYSGIIFTAFETVLIRKPEWRIAKS